MIDIPLSLYVHFPWCVRKCPYCDFNSHAAENGIPEAQYLNALLTDLESQSSDIGTTTLVSIFMGGGTPSLFSPGTIATLMEAIRSRYDIADAEVTLEANPGTFDQSHYTGYRQAGVNRLSIGVQSFNDSFLVPLGRIHDSRAAEQAYEGAMKAGFERINLDLMYGLPGQSGAQATADLTRAIELQPQHISWYQLTIEPNTVFYRHPPTLPNEDHIARMMDDGLGLLSGAGYERYEISAYSQAGGASRHNLNYWQFGDYLGIGAGAHGKLTRDGAMTRTTKSRMPADYMKAPARTLSTLVPHDQLLTEFLMNSLRLSSGFRIQDFEERTGLGREALDGFTERALARSLVIMDSDRIAPTSKGQDFLNELLLQADE